MSRQPMVPEPARMRAGDADRDVILSVIQDAFANGRLSTSEVSERQERALTSVYTDELLPIVFETKGGRGSSATGKGGKSKVEESTGVAAKGTATAKTAGARKPKRPAEAGA